MSEDSFLDDDELTLTDRRRVDQICVAYEDAWKAGQRPRPEQYLAGMSEPERSALLRELCLLESYYLRAEAKAEHGRFLPGMLLANRYRIVGLLGRGGMGEVFRADDLKLGQPLALKFLPERLASDSSVLMFLHNEVRLARQIAHPNICRVYDIGEIDGQHFLSMEYVDGEDLASLLRRIGRLPPDKGLTIARQMVAGLAAAHHQGILHRDLKPANIMLDARGQVRIMDFGLACFNRTDGGQQLPAGTPPYMAPEQLAGGPATIRSDLYSLGLVFYEMYVGQRPFRADATTKSAGMDRTESPVPPSSLVEGLEPDVDQVILQCLEKSPQDRPASASAVLTALPGFDTLSAALAAGETPSPETVAAAGPAGSLRPVVGVLCLAGVFMALLAVVQLSNKATLVGQADLESPHALAGRGLEILTALGYDNSAADSACGFAYEDDRSQLAPISFWYRQSSSVLVPQLFAGSFTAQGDGTVSPVDPPPKPGDSTLWLDGRGRLLRLWVYPSARNEGQSTFDDGSPNGEAAFPPWSLGLFRQAGLIGTEDPHGDMKNYISTSVNWQPPVSYDSKQAWDGHHPYTGSRVHVQAAAVDGRPVYFSVVPQEQVEQQQTQSRSTSAIRVYARITIFLILVIMGALLARYNWRRGRGDWKGARRLACYVLIVYAIYWVLYTGRAAKPPPWPVFIMGMEMSVFVAFILWLFHIALEPYVRRHWPETMISWSRLMRGRYRDPLVGRDLLVGALFGVSSRLLWQIGILAPAWCGLGQVDLLGPQGGTMGVLLRPLLGGRYCLSELIHYQATAISAGVCALLLWLLLRLILRKQFLVGSVFVLYGALVLTIGVGHPYFSWLIGGLGALLLVVVLTRFGLLALVSYMYVRLLLTFPITTDLSRWNAGSTTLLPLGVIFVLAAYGFYVSRAGRPLFPSGPSRTSMLDRIT